MAVVAVILVVGTAVALYASLTSDSPRSAPGCIDVTAASTMGAAEFHSCGVDAARLCRAQAGRDDVFAHAVLASCRGAGIQTRGPSAPPRRPPG